MGSEEFDRVGIIWDSCAELGTLAVRQVVVVGFEVVMVFITEVEPDDAHVLDLRTFWHFPRRPGRQLPQALPAFEHAQFLHLPVLLQRQQDILFVLGHGKEEIFDSYSRQLRTSSSLPTRKLPFYSNAYTLCMYLCVTLRNARTHHVYVCRYMYAV